MVVRTSPRNQFEFSVFDLLSPGNQGFATQLASMGTARSALKVRVQGVFDGITQLRAPEL